MTPVLEEGLFEAIQVTLSVNAAATGQSFQLHLPKQALLSSAPRNLRSWFPGAMTGGSKIVENALHGLGSGMLQDSSQRKWGLVATVTSNLDAWLRRGCTKSLEMFRARRQ